MFSLRAIAKIFNTNHSNISRKLRSMGIEIVNQYDRYKLIDNTKICFKCKIKYDNATEHFKKDPTKKDGLYSYCKECNKKDWKDNYPNIVEKHRAECKKYAKNNQPKIKAYRKKYYQNDKEFFKEKTKQWQLDNPEKRKASHSRCKANRRAMLSRVKNDLTANDIRIQHKEQNGKCHYCKIDVGLDYHVDHVIPIAKGGENTLSNIVIACPKCNLSKGVKTVEEFKDCRHSWDLA